jgi:hypothetical protein
MLGMISHKGKEIPQEETEEEELWHDRGGRKRISFQAIHLK